MDSMGRNKKADAVKLFVRGLPAQVSAKKFPFNTKYFITVIVLLSPKSIKSTIGCNSMYCINCGSECKLYEHLCGPCYIKKTKFFKLREVVKITLCSQCSAREKANHWEEYSSDKEAIDKAVIENIVIYNGIRSPNFKLELQPIRTNNLRATVSIEARYDDLKINAELISEVRLKYSTCARCSRVLGNYFEAIIQLRGADRKLDENELNLARTIVESVLTTLDHPEPNAFLSKVEYLHGGIDFYIGSSTIAKQISRDLSKKFAGKIKESSSLMGRKDGSDVYRFTYSIRLPEYKIGDFIKADGRIYQVLKILQKHIHCIDLRSGQTTQLKHQALTSAVILGADNLVYDAVVVVESDIEVQILDPENLKIVELVKPKNFQVTCENVKIFKDQDDIFLIPNLV